MQHVSYNAKSRIAPYLPPKGGRVGEEGVGGGGGTAPPEPKQTNPTTAATQTDGPGSGPPFRARPGSPVRLNTDTTRADLRPTRGQDGGRHICVAAKMHMRRVRGRGPSPAGGAAEHQPRADRNVGKTTAAAPVWGTGAQGLEVPVFVNTEPDQGTRGAHRVARRLPRGRSWRGVGIVENVWITPGPAVCFGPFPCKVRTKAGSATVTARCISASSRLERAA